MISMVYYWFNLYYKHGLQDLMMMFWGKGLLIRLGFFNTILWTRILKNDLKLHYIPHAWNYVFNGFLNNEICWWKEASKPKNVK